MDIVKRYTCGFTKNNVYRIMHYISAILNNNDYALYTSINNQLRLHQNLIKLSIGVNRLIDIRGIKCAFKFNRSISTGLYYFIMFFSCILQTLCTNLHNF